MSPALNSLSDLLAASRGGQTIAPEDFERIVFGARETAQNGTDDELMAGLPPPHPQYVQNAILVLGKALEINSDEHRVLTWFLEERLSLFAMATPVDVIASGHTDALLKYLESISAGSSA